MILARTAIDAMLHPFNVANNTRRQPGHIYSTNMCFKFASHKRCESAQYNPGERDAPLGRPLPDCSIPNAQQRCPLGKRPKGFGNVCSLIWSYLHGARTEMSPAAFAMLMAAAEKEFLAAFKTEDLDTIESALEAMRQITRAYYGYDTFCAAPHGVQAA